MADALLYVLKTKSGNYWNGKRWAPCRRCAFRMTRDNAHRQAHKDNNEGWRVIRMRERVAQVQSVSEEGK